MQVFKHEEQKKFEPVAISIKFESEEELAVFKDMFSYNLSIPELVYLGKNSKKENLLTSVMITIFSKINLL